MENEQETSYLRNRQKKSSMSLSCCFHGHGHRFDSSDSFSSSSPMMSPPWFRSKGNDELPEAKGKSRNIMSRMAGGGRHARRHSGDFSYDPLSYALNFDTSSDPHYDDFAARLPVSPPSGRPSLSSQLRNLEPPSPQKSAATELKVKMPSTAAGELPSQRKSAAVQKLKMPSPSSLAMEGEGVAREIERMQAVAREISVEY